MYWRKYDLWKAGIVVAVVLFLVHIALVTVSVTNAHEGVSGTAVAGTVTVQTRSTVDATLTALNKEKFVREIQQLKDQSNPDLLAWYQANSAILLSTFVVVIGGLIGLLRWLGDRQDEQEKLCLG